MNKVTNDDILETLGEQIAVIVVNAELGDCYEVLTHVDIAQRVIDLIRDAYTPFELYSKEQLAESVRQTMGPTDIWDTDDLRGECDAIDEIRGEA
jgi:hypothetical protein